MKMLKEKLKNNKNLRILTVITLAAVLCVALLYFILPDWGADEVQKTSDKTVTADSNKKVSKSKHKAKDKDQSHKKDKSEEKKKDDKNSSQNSSNSSNSSKKGKTYVAPVYKTVTHPEVGHYESTTLYRCACGADGFKSQAEWQAHRPAH